MNSDDDDVFSTTFTFVDCSNPVIKVESEVNRP